MPSRHWPSIPLTTTSQEHIVGNEAADDFFALGRWIGSSQVQVGSAVGLWVVGRYVMPPAADGSRTNKVSHLGFDLLRAHMVSQSPRRGIETVGSPRAADW